MSQQHQQQQLASLLDSHKQQQQKLIAERHQLLQQNANLLRGYIQAGLNLPGPSSNDASDRRELLVAQLVQEEGAARAALEALKRGTPLAKAREIGESVMRQAQDLAAVSAGDANATVSLEAGPAAVAAAGSQTAQRKTVLLITPDEAASPTQPRKQFGKSASAWPTVTTATKAGEYSSSKTAAGRLHSPELSAADGRCAWHDDDEDDGMTSHRPANRGRHHEHPDSWQSRSPGPQQHQQQYDAADTPPAYIQDLKTQVASLQTALENQMKVANPWSQLLPAAVTAAAMMANPAAALAAAGQAGGLMGHGFGGMPGLAGLSMPQAVPSELLQSDPSLAAAAAAHARDMALLRMDVEHARGVAELQQIKSQLAQLQQAGNSGGPHQLAALLHDAVQANRQQGMLQDAMAQQQQQPGEELQYDVDDTASMQHKLSDPDDWLAGLPAAADGDASIPAGGGPGAAGEDEVLGLEQGSAVLAARGSNADMDVLQVHTTTAGPFSKRGTYRVSVVLYDGYQPVESAPCVQVCATTSKRLVTPPGTTGAGAQTGDDGGDAAGSAAAGSPGVARFNESLSLKGVKLASSTQLVFELYMAKPGLAGLPTKEVLVGWTVAPLLLNGQVLPGQQSMPLFRLPLMLTAQRKFTFDHALLDFKLAHYRGAPGDVELGAGASSGVVGAGGVGAGVGLEDIPGVPSEAWVRVQRGVPPADPYTPGDGFVVMVDGGRFLPCSTTISKVIGSVWSSNGSLLAGPFEGVAQPDSDTLNPAYMCTATLGSSQNGTRFEDPTATLMLQVQTIERTSRALRVVGFALFGLFLDPKTTGQPVSRSIQDYVLNQGAFQVPLHAGAPSTSGPLRVTSLDDTPRLPCASLLLRVLTPEAAKLQRRKAAPSYGERVYDTVSRCMPTTLERKLYAKVLHRRSLVIREAARLVAWFSRQAGGLGGKRASSRRNTAGAQPVSSGAAGVTGTGTNGGLLSRVFGGSSDEEAAAAAAAASMNTGDPAAATEEEQSDLDEAKAEPLPQTDPEIMDWMSDIMTDAAAAGSSKPSSAGGELSFINYNTGYEYSADLGFFVALDGAARLSRLLPAAGLVSYSPPGSLYQDHPVVDDVKVTLDYDLDAPLAAPRWLDGYQQFADVPYQAGLVLLFDVRCVVPGSGSSAPVGWACLPVFEKAGRFVASGTYHLPLFQGVPSHQLLADLSARGDPDTVMCAAINSGRVRPAIECSSVLVRLMCGSRQGQLEAPAWSMPLQELRLPRYVVSDLGPRFVAEMRKMIKNKTYSQAKPKALTDEQWMDQINDTLIKVAGLDENMDGGDSGDEGEPGSREVDEATAAVSGLQPRSSIAVEQQQVTAKAARAQGGAAAARQSQKQQQVPSAAAAAAANMAGAAVDTREKQRTPLPVPGTAVSKQQRQQRMAVPVVDAVSSRRMSQQTPLLSSGGAAPQQQQQQQQQADLRAQARSTRTPQA